MRSSKHAFREFRRTRPTPAATAGREPKPHGRGWSYLREYFRWLRPFTRGLSMVFVVALIAAVLGLAVPRATMHIVDVVLPRGQWQRLHALCAGLLAIILVQQSLELLRNWHIARLNARALFRLRQRLFRRLMRLPLHELSEMKTGGLTSRLSGDVDLASNLLQSALVSPAVAVTRILLTLGVLLWINWRMSLAAVLLIPPVLALNLFYVKRIRPIYRSMRDDRAAIDGRVVEVFGGIRVVRAFRREATEALSYGVRHHIVIRKQLLAVMLESVVTSGWGVVIPLCGLLVVWLGGALVLRQQATVGGLIAFQMYILMLLHPVSSLVFSYGQVQRELAALERVFDLLKRPPDKPDRPHARPAPATVEVIAFDHVTFGYRPGQPVLHDFTLRVPGGTTVALVGPSGSGKTTVTNLVARFYDPDAGALRLNGFDLRDLRLQSYRRLLGLVQQDVFLFDGTIAENIGYSRRDATRAQIEAAARQANAHGFITSFPEGYDTLVGERGVRLSGGQAQRLSIARAVLADPRILLLDEATSNLDSESEQLIQESLRELLVGRTTFVIAHRLSTIVNADCIVVLEQGRIVETGTHAELVRQDSNYRAMVERQQRGLGEALAPGAWVS